MEDRPVFRPVDLLAREHSVDPPAQARFLRQLQEKPDCLVGDPVLRIIQKKSACFRGQCLAALRVSRKQVAEMQTACLPGMALESLPGDTFREARRGA